MIGKNKKIIILIFMVITISYFNPSFYQNQNNFISDNKVDSPLFSRQISQTKQWLKNPTFEAPVEPTWFWTNGTEGDNTDLKAFTSANQANYGIMGENRSFTVVSGIINNSINSLGWKQVNNIGYIQPDTAEIRSYGCYVYHRWQDDANQFPSVHWRKNISVPIDMSDYVITSASLEVIFNASANSNVDTPNDDGSWDFFANGDSASFYVQISDLGYNPPLYTVAFNKTKYLGQQNFSQPTILTISDNPVSTVSEIDLITALNSAFEKDPSHSNFTITIGIDIYCEDNVPGSDDDIFDSLIVKTCDLSFNCTKKIDHSTTLSWNQISGKLDGQTIEITEAKFNYKYKVDKLWPIIAPLSEIRFFINDKLYEAGTIKLTNANASFQDARSGGFDVTGFIEMNANISVSIQVYLKDSFEFTQNINISITEVFLNISYIMTLPDYDTNLQLFINNQNKTLNPFLDVPIGEQINITVKFANISTGAHIIGANVLLTGDRVLKNLTESLIYEHFTTEINSTADLNMGDNFLTIKAQNLDHETQILNLRINVRKISTEIIPVLGSNIINIEPGESVNIDVIVNNTDYDETVKGAIVTYTWDLGQGEFIDDNNDGIYNTTINNIPAGAYTISITAFSGENYSFETYQIIINANIPSNPFWTALLYVLIGGIIGIVSIFTIYQTYLKYPPIVRKIRKLRKKVRKGRKLKSIILENRGDIIERILIEKQDILKSATKVETEKKIRKTSNLVEKEQETINNKGGFQ
ncbi:MAG: hypothetical protein ACFE8C_08830 [Promethearchaeota archaeon]